MNTAATIDRYDDESVGRAARLDPDAAPDPARAAPSRSVPPINARAARLLRAGADLLESQGGDGFRERAYRAAAATLDALERPVDAILAEQGRAVVPEALARSGDA